MTNGPFLQVRLNATVAGEKSEGTAGDDVIAANGRARLWVRVQCPNWFDVDRVQVLLNGRLSPELNFTRASHPGLFSSRTVRFEHEMTLELSEDTHVIVAAVGENSRLGAVVGPGHADDWPVAISNPIFVDVDGQGFKANGDLLAPE